MRRIIDMPYGKKRNCSACGKSGHNIRSCRKNSGMRIEELKKQKELEDNPLLAPNKVYKKWPDIKKPKKPYLMADNPNGITLEEVINFRVERFNKSSALIEKKGHDYNRSQQKDGDTLFNLRVCKILGIVGSDTTGILVRLSDKFMRLVSLTNDPTSETQVKEESVFDTIDDIHNYVDYLGLMYLKGRGK